MLDVTVKTLDGKNRSFSVPDDITVKEFKEKIAASIDITVENQRLIFIGRVLQDDKKLNQYDVNGKTLHVVERPPPSVRNQNGASNSPSTSSASEHRAHGHGAHNIVLGSIQLPGDNMDPANMQNIVQQALSGMGGNARVSTRSSADGSSVDVHINLGHVQMPHAPSESQRRIDVARKMINQARDIVNRIENPTSTRSSQNSSTNQSPATTGSGSTGATGQTEASDGATEREDDSLNDSLYDHDDDDEDDDDDHEMHDVEAISIVTETVEAEIEMETDETNGTSSVSAIRIPPGAQSTVETVEIGHHHGGSGGGLNLGHLSSAHAGVPTTSATTSSSDSSQGATGGSTTAAAGTQTSPPRPTHPAPSAYADLLGELFELQQRLQPHFERYQRILRDDPNFDGQVQECRDTQRFYNQVSQIMHNLSHAYHSMSDLMLDLNQAPARQMRAAPTPLPSVMQHAIPVQRSVSITHVPVTATGGRVNTTAPNPVTSSTTTRVTPSSSATTQNAAGGATRTTTTPSTAVPPQQSGAIPFQFAFPGMPGGLPGMMAMASGAGGVPGGPQVSATTTGAGPGGMGNFAAGVGRPPFMPPDVFENIIRMATSAATSAVHQHQFTPGGAPGGPRPQGQVFVMTQAGNLNTSTTPPTSTSATSGPTPPISAATAATPNIRIATSTNIRPGGHIHIAPGGISNTIGSGIRPPPYPGTVPLAGMAPGQGNQPRGVAIAIPGPPPVGLLPPGVGMNVMGINTIDPFLPCHSRHFLSRRVAGMTRGGQRGAANGNNAENGLAGVVSDIVNNMMGQNAGQAAAPTSQPNASSTTTNATGATGPVLNPFAALFGGNIRAPVPGMPGGVNPQAPVSFADQLRNILQQGQTLGPAAATGSTTTPSQPPATSTTSSSTTTTSEGATARPVTDEMFTELVAGIGQYVGQASTGQRPTGTISDFLTSLGEGYNTPLGESLLSDIFNIVSSSINLADLMQLFAGNSACLQNSRAPLQEYIDRKMLNGQTANAQNIEAAIDRMMEDATPVLEQACLGLVSRDDIDIEATFHTFVENHLTELTTFVMNSRGQDQDFHRSLYTRVRRMIHEAIVLGECCLEGGFAEVCTVVHGRVANMATDVNPLIRQWMSDVTVQQLETLRPNIMVLPSDVQPYIIKRSHMETARMETASHSSEENDENFMSADEDAPEDNKTTNAEEKSSQKKKTEEKDTQKAAAAAKKTSSTSSSHSSSSSNGTKPKVRGPRGPNDRITPRVAPEGGEHPQRQTEGEKAIDETTGEILCIDGSSSTARLRPQMTPMAYHTVRCAARPEDDHMQANVRMGSEDWHSVVPEEWVPVIAKDIERQKTKEKQKPFSDAYINGNPAKKRRVSSKYNQCETEQLVRPENSIAEAVQIAATAVGAQPLTGSATENLNTDIAANAPLQQAFHQEVRNEVRKNLREEKDLVPYKYKNTEKYFGNRK